MLGAMHGMCGCCCWLWLPCRPRSLVVLGRPGVSVVGLLRDICHLLSSSPEQGGLGLHVMLSDTTGRIAGV